MSALRSRGKEVLMAVIEANKRADGLKFTPISREFRGRRNNLLAVRDEHPV